MAETKELLSFLSLDTREDVRSGALRIVLGLTASEQRKEFFQAYPEFIDAMISIAKDDESHVMRRDAFCALTNIAEIRPCAQRMVDKEALPVTVARIMNEEEPHPDEPCLLLGNISRHEPLVERLVLLKHDDKPALHCLVDVFCKSKHHNENGRFHHLANTFFNVTQHESGRQLLMARNEAACIIQRLLPFTQYEHSRVRRGGVVGALRNCCFVAKEHEWLLSDDVNLLPNIILPLAGPEELDEDDMEGMLDDLQYLPPDKEREADADIRKMLLETLLRLCATKHGRTLLRDVKVYPILREYHKWEPEEDVREACEQVVHVLIADEPENVGDLTTLDVSPENAAMFEQVKETIRRGEGPDVELVPSKDGDGNEEDDVPAHHHDEATQMFVSSLQPVLLMTMLRPCWSPFCEQGCFQYMGKKWQKARCKCIRQDSPLPGFAHGVWDERMWWLNRREV